MVQEAIQHLTRNDPTLSAIIQRVGEYRIQFREPNFESLVRSIVYQQLSGKVASVIYGRLAEAVKGRMLPEEVLKLRPDRMRRLGLSKQKAAYIRDLARHARDRRARRVRSRRQRRTAPDGWPRSATSRARKRRA